MAENKSDNGVGVSGGAASAETDEARSGAGEQEPQGAGEANGQASAGNGPGEGGGEPAQAPPEGGQGGGADAATLRERLMRLAAEFDNYRKRVERERSESFVRAQAQLAERLLEPLADLQRIADFDPATTPATALHEGAEMVEKKFLRALEAAGLEEIEADGKPFDPTQHEALTTVPAESEAEDDTVAQVYQKGYRFKGVLLRPARVVVKKFDG